MLGRKVAALLIIGVLILVTTACTKIEEPGAEAGEEPAGWPTRVSIGSASVGGGFYLGATALATVINNYIDGVDALVEITGASNHNAELLQAGEVEFGLVGTNVMWEAYNGKLTYEGTPHDKIRSLMPGWPGVSLMITLEKYGIDDVRDFDGKSFSGGPVGSSLQLWSEYVFDALDVHPQIVHLPTSDAARALGDGTIQGFAVGWPAPVITELEMTHDVKIVTLNEEQIDKFREKYPHFPAMEVPPGQLSSCPDGVLNTGLYNQFCVRADLPEDFVYEVVKTMYENRDVAKLTLEQMGEGMDFENVLLSTIPYHPGAIRYFREQGVEFPESLIPPEMDE